MAHGCGLPQSHARTGEWGQAGDLARFQRSLPRVMGHASTAQQVGAVTGTPSRAGRLVWSPTSPTAPPSWRRARSPASQNCSTPRAP
eukprot:4530910-Prymnesium_polylepis.1